MVYHSRHKPSYNLIELFKIQRWAKKPLTHLAVYETHFEYWHDATSGKLKSMTNHSAQLMDLGLLNSMNRVRCIELGMVKYLEKREQILAIKELL